MTHGRLKGACGRTRCAACTVIPHGRPKDDDDARSAERAP